MPRTLPLPFDGDTAVAHLRSVDARLRRSIDRTGPLRLLRQPGSPYQALGESVLHQQLNGKAARTILGRLRDLTGGRFPEPAEMLALPVASLRAAGLSGSKTAALRDLAAKTLEGTVPSTRVAVRLSDDELVERLTVVRGVGRWTVQMFLMFRLGRPDVLPVDDYGVRKGFARVYALPDLPKPADMARRAEKWRPYRSVASWYMWRALED